MKHLNKTDTPCLRDFTSTALFIFNAKLLINQESIASAFSELRLSF